MVFPGSARIAPLLSARGGRSAGAHAAHHRPGRHSILQHQHRSERPFSQGPRQARASVLPHGPGDADLPSFLPCLRGSWAHGDRYVCNDRRRLQHAGFAVAAAPVLSPEAAGLLDHDVVSL